MASAKSQRLLKLGRPETFWIWSRRAVTVSNEYVTIVGWHVLGQADRLFLRVGSQVGERGKVDFN